MNCEECRHYDYEQAAKLHGHPCEIHGIANPYGCKDGEKNMEWYAYYYDCNAKKICKYNVFDHGSFMKELKVLLRCDLTRETFAEQLKHIAMYYYWSKCEWETVLKPWVGDDSVEMKIDVYDQLMLNWDKFVDYTWSFSVNGSRLSDYEAIGTVEECSKAVQFAKHYEHEREFL